MDILEFLTQHDPGECFEIVDTLLEGNVKVRKPSSFKWHHIIYIGYSPSFDLGSVEGKLRRRLDIVGWQFVTTGLKLDLKDEQVVPTFGIAPIVSLTVPIAYHATRTCVIHRVVDLQEGLLLSNDERKATTFPDTEGVIHACAKFHCDDGENDSAEWWMQHLSQNNRFNDPSWGILEINLASLKHGRIYQDVHSKSGIVIDRIDRIPCSLIKAI